MCVTVGQRYVERFVVGDEFVRRFAELSGDENPIHVDAAEARTFGYSRCVAHGAILIALISRVIGTRLPGPGAVWMNQSIVWVAPVFVGDEIELVVEVVRVSLGAGLLFLQMNATVGEVTVMTGSGQVKVSPRLSGEESSDTGARVALVTGGSRGIGAAIATRLAAEGCTVVLGYHRDGAAAGVLAAIQEHGGKGSAFQADLAEPGEGARVVQQVLAQHGRLDIVVHGATPPIRRIGVQQASFEDVEVYLAVYLRSAIDMVLSASPGMGERRFGRFIFLGTSYMFGTPPTGLGAYVAGKEALWGYAKSVAGELGPKGITTNLVSPGMTVTDLVSEIPARFKEVEARKSSLRRLATVDDAANLVAFLASDAGGYLNGVNLPLTGGTP
jgi:3-oxoacyl-[acyl-carrier protein] reductase